MATIRTRHIAGDRPLPHRAADTFNHTLGPDNISAINWLPSRDLRILFAPEAKARAMADR